MLVLLSLSHASWAWGKRGHQIVAENAAIIVSSEPEAAFMRAHSFDFAYYANVPDFIWKRPGTYEMEKSEHFMDLEIFDRVFAKRKDVERPLELSRAEFDTKFPEIKQKDGRAFWRIRELVAKLEKQTAELKQLKEEKGKVRQDLQEKWMNIAGPLTHYVGDLSMPLHVSENYDGQMTDQKGIHHYFEEAMVDQLYPDLAVKVHAQALGQWNKFKVKNSGKTILGLLEQQTANSLKDVAPMLKLDKGRKRSVDKKEAQRYETIIVRRMVDATLTLAEIFRRHLGWKFDGDRFYFFNGEPAYIKPGAE